MDVKTIDPALLKTFECTGCGDCCRWSGSVLLTAGDINRMADALGLSEQAFIDRHTRLAPNRTQLALIDNPDESCSFLEGDRCSVYEARPEQCRSFPYVWSVSEGCPALDKLSTQQKNIEHHV
jgi:Fe-S-cluster containining protein